MSTKYNYSVQIGGGIDGYGDYEYLGATLQEIRESLPMSCLSVCSECGSATEDELIGFTMIKVQKPFRERPYWSHEQETNAEWEARGTHSGYALRCDNPECATVTPILREERFDDSEDCY